jgi:hypothetical protein
VVGVVNDGWEILAGGSRDNDLLGTSLNVSRSLLLRSIETSALEHYIYIEFAPRKLSSIWLSIDGDLLAVNSDGTRSYNGLAVLCQNSILIGYSVLALAELACETTLSSIILEKVSKHLWAGEVVDSNYFITLCLEHLTESETANTTETVDSYICHLKNLKFKGCE